MTRPALRVLTAALAASSSVLPSLAGSQETMATRDATLDLPAPSDRMPPIVAAAEAFLATLHDEQREAVLSD